MMRKIVSICLLLSLIMNCSIIPAFAVPVVPGTLKIFSDNSAYEIYIDGSFIGKGNIVLNSISPGTHYVKAVYQDKPIFSEITTVRSGELTSLLIKEMANTQSNIEKNRENIRIGYNFFTMWGYQYALGDKDVWYGIDFDASNLKNEMKDSPDAQTKLSNIGLEKTTELLLSVLGGGLLGVGIVSNNSTLIYSGVASLFGTVLVFLVRGNDLRNAVDYYNSTVK